MGARQPRRIEERLAREIWLALALLACSLAQTTLLPRLLGLAPNLLLLLVICQALIAGPVGGARWAFYGGLGLDLCSDTALGSHSLALLAGVLLAGVLLARLEPRQLATAAAGSRAWLAGVSYRAGADYIAIGRADRPASLPGGGTAACDAVDLDTGVAAIPDHARDRTPAAWRGANRCILG